MRGSCHFNRPSNFEIGVEYRMFFCMLFFKWKRVLHFEVLSSYFEPLSLWRNPLIVLLLDPILSSWQQKENKGSILNIKWLVEMTWSTHPSSISIWSLLFCIHFRQKKRCKCRSWTTEIFTFRDQCLWKMEY